MNTKCPICLKLELKERKQIDEALLEKVPYKEIQTWFPDISHITLSRHKRHMGNPQNEIDVTMQRLVNENAQRLMQNYCPDAFIVNVRERLEGLIEDSLTIVEDMTASVLAEKNIKYCEGLRKDAIVNLKNLIVSLESVSGLKQMIDLNAAFNTVTTHGYEVKEPESNSSQPKYLNSASTTVGTDN